MADQAALTIIADVKPNDVDGLKALLGAMNDDPAHNDVLPFGEFGRVHFARFVVLDAVNDLDGRPIPPSLVFLSDIDGSVDAYLNELVRRCGSGIERIYRHCEGYPAVAGTAEQLAYLRGRMVKPAAMYVNTRGRTALQVRHEAGLRNAIEDILDRQDGSADSPAAMRAAIRDFVKGDARLAWAKRPAAGPGLRTRVRELLHLIGVALLVLALSPLIVIGLPFWLVALRLHELRDRAPDIRPSPEHLREVAEPEDLMQQNQFTAVGLVKPGLFRLYTAMAVLWLVNAGVRQLFGRGSLAGVKTIHFARWVFIDDNRRLLFASNYDGSLESYMDDFIDRLAWGLNAVFSNGMGYPKTSWLIMNGARDEQAFKHFIRAHQIPTQLWYSAYDRLPAVNITNNQVVRAGLSGELDEAATEQWLLRL